MRKPKQFTEKFTVDPEQGAVAMLVHLQKPGYHIKEIDRKSRDVIVTFVKNETTKFDGGYEIKT